MSQAAAIPIASAPCMWELHGHVGRTDPCPSCPLLEPGAWPQPLLRVAALLQQELVLSPHPKELGVLQGTGAAVPALLGKEQAHTSTGERLPVLNSPELGQAWARGSPSAQLPLGLLLHARLLWAARGFSHAWGAGCPCPLSQGAGPGLRHVQEQLMERMDVAKQEVSG